MTSSVRRRGALAVAGVFTLSGVVHLVRPAVFRPLMPRRLPRQTEIIYASGAVELVCAYGLFRQQRWAGVLSAAVLLAVWPGNITQAQRISAKQGLGSAPALLAWARVPLQVPMIWAVLPEAEQ